jgi:hypothetical protein
MYWLYVCQRMWIYDNNQSIEQYNSEAYYQLRTAHMKNTTVYWTWYCACITVQDFTLKQHIVTGEFLAMMDKVKGDISICMNFTNALDHVPEAERNNRTIKEWVRAAYHRLPSKALPQQLIRYLVQTQASQLPKEEYHQTIAQEPSSDYPHWIMSNIAQYHLGHRCRPTTKQINKFERIPNARRDLPSTGE